MYWIIVLAFLLCKSSAQLTSPDEELCLGRQVVFVCQQAGSTSRWTVDLPGGSTNELVSSASSSLAGTVLTFTNDPGFGFEIHILNSSTTSSVISELRVTAVRQLNGGTVKCLGISGIFGSTIEISASVAAPSGVMTTADQSQFTPSTASITITWSASSGADNYTIMVTPLLPSGQSLVSTTTTSLQLTVLYNVEYSFNITAQSCAGSNSTIVLHTVAGCSPPSPPANGSISEYSSGAVGAMLTFQCDTGYMPQEEVTSTCLSNRIWVPIPDCTIGDTTVNDGPDFTTTDTQSKGSGNSDTLSTGSQVIITAIICSLVCFILGSLFGAVIVSLACLRYLKNIKNNNKLTSSSSPTPPAASAPVIYEEVSPADSHTERKHDIELKENVAYGPVSKSN